MEDASPLPEKSASRKLAAAGKRITHYRPERLTACPNVLRIPASTESAWRTLKAEALSRLWRTPNMPKGKKTVS